MHMDAICIASALCISVILVILSDAVGWRALYVVWDDWEVVWMPQLASSFRLVSSRGVLRLLRPPFHIVFHTYGSRPHGFRALVRARCLHSRLAPPPGLLAQPSWISVGLILHDCFTPQLDWLDLSLLR
ncbi:hypothetical protein EV363DRAFT_1227688 [Boletus edulis]|uniref:Uncharacterized protein n=1 Tax=Boletus edulis BED1 TaxID=1328754 RepID=A0AAD4GAD2_BOLED|nr:hypothetical protein EV363DRAFT_1364331 [Boletus edulis]KAF8124085.1 hypothetical protein EV363DRAFT_1227688 [Boletus edulis]KAF8431923.1 hypothetical protein L210DRAFT_3559130 [Boletus edulis BED1]